MHFIQVVCLIMLSAIVWIGFYPRCNFFYTTHVHAFPCIVLLLSLTLLSMCISLSTLVYLTMAPKAQKSVPSKNPISRFAYTSSSIPPQLQFCDSNSHKEFEEKFSGWAIHSDRQVILSDFSDTMVSISFISRGWEFLCERPVTYPSMFIKEFLLQYIKCRYFCTQVLYTILWYMYSCYIGAYLQCTPSSQSRQS